MLREELKYEAVFIFVNVCINFASGTDRYIMSVSMPTKIPFVEVGITRHMVRIVQIESKVA